MVSDSGSENVSKSAPAQDSPKPSKILAPSSIGVAALIAVLLALMGTTSYYVYRFGFRSKGDKSEIVETKTVETATVSALGHLSPEGDIVNLSAPIAANGASARLARLGVDEGDLVAAGDLVAVLDSAQSLSAVVSQAEERVEIAIAQLEQVQAGAKSGAIEAQGAEVAMTESELAGQLDMQESLLTRLAVETETAEVEYERYRRLFEQGAIAHSELDQKRLAWWLCKKNWMGRKLIAADFNRCCDRR